MIVVVVRSRLNDDVVASEYSATAERMSELARTIPGYISHKGFKSDDGEQVTVVEFESEEALQEWRLHPEHLKAKKRGHQAFYKTFKFQICKVIRERIAIGESGTRA